tara:strand:+ start:1161 stop:1331 length:171 start_codon:yes stop_codon:yes gene_type:complete
LKKKGQSKINEDKEVKLTKIELPFGNVFTLVLQLTVGLSIIGGVIVAGVYVVFGLR